MTLELTPDNLVDLRRSLQTNINRANNTALALWDGPPGTVSNLQSEAARLQALLDLLTIPATTLHVHQP